MALSKVRCIKNKSSDILVYTTCLDLIEISMSGDNPKWKLELATYMQVSRIVVGKFAA